MKKVVTLCFLFLVLFSFTSFAQDGNNTLFSVPKFSVGYNSSDTLVPVAGRMVTFVPGPNSLDGDDLADIVTCDYGRGGRVHVFEQIAKNSLEFKLVWSSKALKLPLNGSYLGGSPSSTPQTVVVGDLDKNGKKEIIFSLGRKPVDTTLTDTTTPRGIYFYEWDGVTGSNNYGKSPYIVKFESIDSMTKYHNMGRIHPGGLIVSDVDQDGQEELMIGSGYYDNYFDVDPLKSTALIYVTSIQSGTFAAKNAVLKPEYVYTKMAKCIGDTDGYSCGGMTVADVDGDGKNEIIVAGYQINESGTGMGIFKSTAKNTYVDGNVVDISDQYRDRAVRVSCQMDKYRDVTSGRDVVFMLTEENPLGYGNSRLLAIQDIVDISLFGQNNVNVLRSGNWGWGSVAVGDQDHGTTKDGFDVYFYSNDNRVMDLEYKGTGILADSNSYNLNSIFSFSKILNSPKGYPINLLVPPVDINGNGRKELILGSQLGGEDTLINGNIPYAKRAPFFIIEWGDTLNGTLDVKPLTLITAEDYKLEQNYPNPFNPSTTIRFSLPASENISLVVYDLNGREVKRLIDGQKFEKGAFEANWDGKNTYGKNVASGIYFYKLRWGNFEKSMKMTLLK